MKLWYKEITNTLYLVLELCRKKDMEQNTWGKKLQTRVAGLNNNQQAANALIKNRSCAGVSTNVCYNSGSTILDTL